MSSRLKALITIVIIGNLITYGSIIIIAAVPAFAFAGPWLTGPIMILIGCILTGFITFTKIKDSPAGRFFYFWLGFFGIFIPPTIIYILSQIYQSFNK